MHRALNCAWHLVSTKKNDSYCCCFCFIQVAQSFRQWFLMGQGMPLGGIWQLCLEMFLVVLAGKVLYHLVGRGQWCCQTLYNAQHSPSSAKTTQTNISTGWEILEEESYKPIIRINWPISSFCFYKVPLHGHCSPECWVGLFPPSYCVFVAQAQGSHLAVFYSIERAYSGHLDNHIYAEHWWGHSASYLSGRPWAGSIALCSSWWFCVVWDTVTGNLRDPEGSGSPQGADHLNNVVAIDFKVWLGQGPCTL